MMYYIRIILKIPIYPLLLWLTAQNIWHNLGMQYWKWYCTITLLVRIQCPEGRQEIFLFSKMSRQILGPAGLLWNKYWDISLRVKEPVHEVNNSPPSSAKVKNECSYISTAPPCLHGMDRDVTLYIHPWTQRSR
jgi:hypothetical protein